MADGTDPNTSVGSGLRGLGSGQRRGHAEAGRTECAQSPQPSPARRSRAPGRAAQSHVGVEMKLDSPSRRPLSLTLIALLCLLEGAMVLLAAQEELLVFGFTTTGRAVLVARAMLVLLWGYTAHGLWRLREPARRFAIGFFTYDVLNMFITIGIPSRWEAFRQSWQIPPVLDAATVESLVRAGFLLMGLLDLVVVWCLLRQKSKGKVPDTR